jgi:putative transposase
MLRAHKIEMSPTAEQALYFARACGVARFAWNWALAEWNRQHEAGGKPTEAALRKQLNGVKRQQFPWMLEVSKFAPAVAIMNLGKAFARFFVGKGRRPRFKRKGAHDSFYAGTSDGTFECQGRRIRLPRVGWVRMRQELRFAGRLISATVSRTADRWFVAVLVDTPWETPPRKNQACAGVDLGLNDMATCSDGTVFAAPRPLRPALRRLRRAGRRLSRKQRGSRNRAKARHRLARQHYRVANIRKDALHKATAAIVRRFSCVAIEDLNVRGMAANHRLARAILDVGLSEFRRQLAYKAELYGTVVEVADRWFPSSKLCSACGQQREDLPLHVRAWQCSACGARHDRDLNAARNLAQLCTLGQRGTHACGDRSPVPSTSEGTQPVGEAGIRLPSRECQEPNYLPAR